MNFRVIIFRGRRKDNGEWIEGAFIQKLYKGGYFLIYSYDDGTYHPIYRESLEMKDYDDKWMNV